MITRSSLPRLKGVHPSLVQMVTRLDKICPIDFGIPEEGGVRSKAAALRNADKGTGVPDSLHCLQSDGYGWAVDLVPHILGKLGWDQATCEAMRPYVFRAADECNVLVQHGADWDADDRTGEAALKEWDWPHYQLIVKPDRRAQAETNRKARASARECTIAPTGRGDESVHVARLQRLLCIPSDGIFGPGTERIVRAFQSRRIDLVVSGRADQATIDVLKRFERQAAV